MGDQPRLTEEGRANVFRVVGRADQQVRSHEFNTCWAP
jgi:hypothetical protein